jgi:hypothetical protein
MVESVRIHVKYDTSITRAYHAIAERKDRPIAKVAVAHVKHAYFVLGELRQTTCLVFLHNLVSNCAQNK